MEPWTLLGWILIGLVGLAVVIFLIMFFVAAKITVETMRRERGLDRPSRKDKDQGQ
jgi:hypothetical protein